MLGWLKATLSISSVTFFSPSIKAHTIRRRVGDDSKLKRSAAISNTLSPWSGDMN
jgi:hypothetical protein